MAISAEVIKAINIVVPPNVRRARKTINDCINALQSKLYILENELQKVDSQTYHIERETSDSLKKEQKIGQQNYIRQEGDKMLSTVTTYTTGKVPPKILKMIKKYSKKYFRKPNTDTKKLAMEKVDRAIEKALKLDGPIFWGVPHYEDSSLKFGDWRKTTKQEIVVDLNTKKGYTQLRKKHTELQQQCESARKELEEVCSMVGSPSRLFFGQECFSAR
jgi:prefoldin subunit 5